MSFTGCRKIRSEHSPAWDFALRTAILRPFRDSLFDYGFSNLRIVESVYCCAPKQKKVRRRASEGAFHGGGTRWQGRCIGACAVQMPLTTLWPYVYEASHL